MVRLLRHVTMIAVLALVTSTVNDAEAMRWRRTNCRPCATSCCPCRASFGDDFTCIMNEAYEIAPGDILYYANYFEGSCDAEPQPVYFEGGDDYPIPEDCNKGQCISGSFRQTYALGVLPHATAKTFQGFPQPLPANFPRHWSPSATETGNHYEKLQILDENVTYNVQVFDVTLGTGQSIHVAFEIAGFPGTPPNTYPLGSGNVKKCVGNHAYSLQYRGKRVLLLTAQH